MKRYISLHLLILLLIFFIISTDSVYCNKVFSAEPRLIKIPLNQSRTIKLINLKDDRINLNFDEALIETELNTARKEITVKGICQGETWLNITSGSNKVSVKILIKEFAGYLPESLNITVSGNPCPKDIVRKAVLVNLDQSVNLNKNAKYSIEWIKLKKIKNTYPDEEYSFHIPVTLKGKDYIELKKNITIHVKNTAFDQNEARYLYLSNNPETVNSNQVVYNQNISDVSKNRLFFHHRNADASNVKNFYVKLTNISQKPSEILISQADSGPTQPEIQAGHMAVLNYFLNSVNQTNWLLNIPAGKSCIITNQRLYPGDVVSGIYDLELLDNSKINIKIIMTSDPYEFSQTPEIKTNINHSSGIYEPSTIKNSYDHIIGTEYAFVSIGDEPFVKELTSSSPDWGNYGVIYNISVKIINPFNDERNAYLYFIPRAGKSKAIAVVDNEILDIPGAWNTEKILLKTYTLLPNETRTVTIKTIPQGGSNYPVHFSVESEFVKKQ